MSKPTQKPAGKPSGAILSDRAQRAILGLICFCAGAAIMIIEITANRLLAPYFGNSIYTWTALIGVVLIAFSVGGYLGGRLADKSGPALLGKLLGGAAVLTIIIPPLGFYFGPQLANTGQIAGPVLISLFMFAAPGILLGAVSPASVRFYSQVVGEGHVGAAAGVISMLGSLGSFVGTFLSGFFLLSTFGVKSIFYGTALVLIILAVLAFWMAGKTLKQYAAVTLIALSAATVWWHFGNEEQSSTVIYDKSSFYHRIRVKEEMINLQVARTLYLDNTLEGGIYADSPGLPLEYQNFWRLVELNSDITLQRALFIGAGAFGMPAEVSKVGKGVDVDVAEIDPAVIETGRLHFKLNEHPKVNAHAMDGRRFLQASPHKYDLIFGDAYQGIRHIPPHLVTKEFFQELEAKLSDKGVFLMNVISSVEGPRSELLGDILATLRTVFPYVDAFAVRGGSLSESQNVILLASRQSWKPWLEDQFFLPSSPQAHMVNRHLKSSQLPTTGKVLTDNWNPVEAVIARQLLQ